MIPKFTIKGLSRETQDEDGAHTDTWPLSGKMPAAELDGSISDIGYIIEINSLRSCRDEW